MHTYNTHTHSSIFQCGLLSKIRSLIQTFSFASVVVVMFSISLVPFGGLDHTFYSSIPAPVRSIHDSFDGFSLTNPYGLFRRYVLEECLSLLLFCLSELGWFYIAQGLGSEVKLKGYKTTLHEILPMLASLTTCQLFLFLFRMTGVGGRPEVIFEGSVDDGVTWMVSYRLCVCFVSSQTIDFQRPMGGLGCGQFYNFRMIYYN